jgi:hypothetical protein
MILVVGSRFDPVAREIVSAWQSAEAILCDADDVTAPGWRYEPHHPASAVAVAAGRRIPSTRIDAVLTLRPAIYEAELPHFVPEDRSFVATEINAFMLAFLTALRCPVANRPAGISLSGPLLRPEQWARLAHRAGIVPLAVERDVPGTLTTATLGDAETRTIFVAGDRIVGDVAPKLAQCAVTLARAAGALMLGITFDGGETGPRFVAASAQPSVQGAERRAALLEALLAPVTVA